MQRWSLGERSLGLGTFGTKAAPDDRRSEDRPSAQRRPRNQFQVVAALLRHWAPIQTRVGKVDKKREDAMPGSEPPTN